MSNTSKKNNQNEKKINAENAKQLSIKELVEGRPCCGCLLIVFVFVSSFIIIGLITDPGDWHSWSAREHGSFEEFNQQDDSSYKISLWGAIIVTIIFYFLVVYIIDKKE